MIIYPELPVSSLFIRSQHHSPAHGPSATAVARNDASAWLRSRRKHALPPTVAGTIAGYRFRRFGVFLSGATVLLSDARQAMNRHYPRRARPARPALNPLHPSSPRRPADLRFPRNGSGESCSLRALATGEPYRRKALSG